MNMENQGLGIREIPKPHKMLLLSLQHLFAMFGATILVPVLVGLNPGIALISSGIGTLTYIAITKGRLPSYLGSSFAFISPIIAVKAGGGPGAALVGSFLAGVVYAVVALIIKGSGTKWLMKMLPPIVVGPVIIVIGLGLSGTAVDMAMKKGGEYDTKYFIVALVTLAITIIASVFFKGFLGLVPILFGIVGGYAFAWTQGLVNFSDVKKADWIAAPDFTVPFVSYTPHLTWGIVAIMVPIAVVTLAEHIGHILVLNKVVNKNFLEEPGLHRSIMGDGVATMIAAIIGGPPSTTYGENIGVMAITKVFSVFVIGGAAVIAILFGFIGKISALISSIPSPVMGGVSILLFGIIASSGLRTMVESKVDLSSKRNLVISSVILVLGVGGAMLQITDEIKLDGMALSAIVGVLLNLVLPQDKVEEDVETQGEQPSQVKIS
ncbi:solute carrier family 23 protein [Priestia koreensis]|uniref:solute carrier family 23 protein n=1 Tax=Priestia koreensis TaxID=284581 RepID=UPI0037CB4712